MPEKNDFNYKEFIGNLRQKPGSIWILIGLLGLGIVFIWLGNSPEKNGTAQDPKITPVQSVEESEAYRAEKRLENEVRQALQKIRGVGRVYVDIHLKSSQRKVWEHQSQNSKRVTQQKEEINTEESARDELVLARDREGKDAPILKEEIAPEIEGVLVVASGASDPQVRQLLTETVMTVLNLPAHRVYVAAGEP